MKSLDYIVGASAVRVEFAAWLAIRTTDLDTGNTMRYSCYRDPFRTILSLMISIFVSIFELYKKSFTIIQLIPLLTGTTDHG
jgi:hypothetical protein